MHPAMIVRPLNCVISGAAVMLAALVAIGPDIVEPEFLPAVLAAALVSALVAAGGNVLNDYYDREVDGVNHPERPLPSGAIQPVTALQLSIILMVVSLGVAFLFLPWAALVLAGLAVLTLVGYETTLKRRGLVGNMSISLLVALLFLFGGAAVGNIMPTVGLAPLAFLANLAREIVKDIEDMEGDTDRWTFPMRVGKPAAMYTATAAVVAAVLLSPLPVFPLGIFSMHQYLPVVAVADALLLFAVYVSYENPSAGSSLFKFGMAVALLAFLAGALWG